MKCDASAFASMYETVYTDLYRFALCMMKDPHDAEDAVSEAVVSAYEHIASLRSEKAFKNWIFTILANTCKKKLKAAANQQKQSAFLNEQAAYEAGEETDYGLAVDVRKAFAVLSDEEQMIIGFSVFGGYRSAEIADMLKLNANTVRSKRSRALEKMNVILEY